MITRGLYSVNCESGGNVRWFVQRTDPLSMNARVTLQIHIALCTHVVLAHFPGGHDRNDERFSRAEQEAFGERPRLAGLPEKNLVQAGSSSCVEDQDARSSQETDLLPSPGCSGWTLFSASMWR